MTTLEILKQVRDVLTNRGWTQHAFARDKHGRPCDFDAPGVAKFCLYGALLMVAPYHVERRQAQKVLTSLLPEGFVELVQWNDALDTTYDSVIDLVDAAIQKLDAEERSKPQ